MFQKYLFKKSFSQEILGPEIFFQSKIILSKKDIVLPELPENICLKEFYQDILGPENFILVENYLVLPKLPGHLPFDPPKMQTL